MGSGIANLTCEPDKGIFIPDGIEIAITLNQTCPYSPRILLREFDKFANNATGVKTQMDSVMFFFSFLIKWTELRYLEREEVLGSRIWNSGTGPI